jgi:ribosomal protein S27E
MVRVSRFGTFACPNCKSLYQVVKDKGSPETSAREIICRVCGAPLAGREGKFVLKYFHLREAVRKRNGAAKADFPPQ